MDKYKDKSNSYDMNKIFKPLFIFIFTSFLLACGKQTNNEATSGGNEPAKKSRGLIGATCMNIANPFFKVIEENMRDEAAKHGYDLIYLGCEMDISKQQKQIQDFLAKGSLSKTFLLKYFISFIKMKYVPYQHLKLKKHIN